MTLLLPSRGKRKPIAQISLEGFLLDGLLFLRMNKTVLI